MPTAYRPLDEILAELSLKKGSDFQEVGNLAWTVQRHRARAGKSRASSRAPQGMVSRTSLFYACALQDSGIRDDLVKADLDFKKFSFNIGTADFDDKQLESTSSLQVSHRLEEGLRAYAELEGRNPEVGRRVLAWAIASVPGDIFGERFKAAGGKLSAAADFLRERLEFTASGGPRVNFEYDLESHVLESLRLALALAGGREIDAGHLLRAAVGIARKEPSDAFKWLASVLDDLEPARPTGGVPRSARVRKNLPLSGPLAQSLRVAEPFFRKTSNVWGRDFITWALLADDPALEEVTKEVERPLAGLRDDWFWFVTTGELHRNTEDWRQWWQAAGVSPPRASTYLLTWDPSRTPFARWQEVAETVAESGSAVMNWSGSREVEEGDRVYLMRHQEPLGLVGAGEVVGETVEGPHWDPAEAAKGYKSFMVTVEWQALKEHPLLTQEELLGKTGESELWTRQGSGLPIPPGLARQLDEIWAGAVGSGREEEPTEEITPTEEIAPPRSYISTDAVSAGFGADDFKPSEHDSLGAKKQAEIFATLLVAEEVQLPFALGLLGDWGIGKTFFMRLMQEFVKSYAGRDVAKRTPGMVTRVAQIEFNAWHYVDSDLWASLASHIFDELSEQLSPPKSAVEETRRLLRRKIDSSQREKAEAENAIEEAEIARREAADELEAKQEVRQIKAAKRESSRLERVWRAVLEVGPGPGHMDWPNVAELRKEAEKTAKRLGVTAAIESAEQAQQALVSLRRVYRRGLGLKRTFAADFSGARARWSGLVVAGLVGAVLLWPWLLELIKAQFASPPDWIAKLSASLLRFATVVGVSAGWAIRNINSVSSAIGYLETIQEEIRNPRVEPAKPTEKERELEAQIGRLDAEIATEQRKIEEADRQISAAQAEIQRINAGGLVYDFLEGKVRDSRYLDRLGLISVIRQDLEQLRELLEDWSKHAQEERERKAGSGSGSTWSSDSGPGRALPPIQRIILYIDDLDRCPPERVVQVLQAVHLLLAFDLFVVVVAVDARWLERSLNESYNPWMTAESGRGAPVHRFSAQNYLEKIFQIAFSLPPMDQKGYKDLVKKIAATPDEEAKRRAKEEERWLEEEAKQRAKEEEAKAEVEEGAKEKWEAAPVGPAKGDAEPESEARGTTAQARRMAEEAAAKAQLEAEEAERVAREAEERAEAKRRQEEDDERMKAAERVAAMMLSPSEEDFIAALFPFISTPRLAKRLVNIYRLLRVRAEARKDILFSNFIQPVNGEYRAALLLLAISVGKAEVAAEYLEALHGAGEGEFRRWLEEQAAEFERQGKLLSDERTANNKATGANLPPGDRELRLAKLHAAAGPKSKKGTIAEGIERVIETLQENGGPRFDDRLEMYGRWAREVGRYSFHWHLKPRD